jgi:hypothetical protein
MLAGGGFRSCNSYPKGLPFRRISAIGSLLADPKHINALTRDGVKSER